MAKVKLNNTKNKTKVIAIFGKTPRSSEYSSNHPSSMNRRHAIQTIAIFSAGATLLPACQSEEPIPVFDKIPLEREQYFMLNDLTHALLPHDNTKIITPETTTDFILTMYNDCKSPEDIDVFISGMKAFQAQVQEAYSASFSKLDSIQRSELFAALSQATVDNPAKAFFDTTLGMTRQHFIGSEYFMKNKLDFEFAPGRYLGCQRV